MNELLEITLKKLTEQPAQNWEEFKTSETKLHSDHRITETIESYVATLPTLRLDAAIVQKKIVKIETPYTSRDAIKTSYRIALYEHGELISTFGDHYAETTYERISKKKEERLKELEQYLK